MPLMTLLKKGITHSEGVDLWWGEPPVFTQSSIINLGAWGSVGVMRNRVELPGK